MFDKGLILQIYKELARLNIKNKNKNQTIQLQNEQKT